MTATATVSPTGDLFIDGILYGTKWAVSSLTFSFPSSASFYGANYGSGEPTNDFLAFSATQQAAVRSILKQYSSVINLTFTEVTETATKHADLRYAESDTPSTAWAYFPSAAGNSGDAWFNNVTNWYAAPALGNYAWQAMQHETGHTLGLKHPQTVSGAFGIVPADHDSLEYTVMSYRSYIGAPVTSGYSNEAYGYPQTLMMLDVAALQTMYGANYATNSGDTVYKWNPATGQESINGVLQPASPANKIFMNIWDGGGHDTYDFSNYTTNLKIDLSPGGWTTTSTAQLASLGAGHVAIGNISNSLLYNGNPASLIEDAIGGSGNDTITGNIANNRLTGGPGNDILDGGLGTDTAVYSGARANYQMTQNANGSWTVKDLRAGSPDGTDTLINIEQAQFSDQLVVLGATPPVVTLAPPSFVSFSNDSGVLGDFITNDTMLTFTGSGTAGSTIKLYDGTILLGSVVANNAGAWTVTTAALSNGAHTFTSVATNAGVTSAPSTPLTITIDTVAPGKPVISGFTPDTNITTDHITSASVLTLNGVAEAGSKIQVFDGASLIGTTTTTGSGTWNFVTPTESNGLHHFTATATDVAGNVSVASGAFDVTVDTVAPNAPVISGFSPDTGVIGDHHTQATVLTLAGTAEANSSVKIYDGSLLIGSAQTSANGAWNYVTLALPNGNHAFTAKAMDLAGNISGASAALAVTVDPIVTGPVVNHPPTVSVHDVSAVANQVFAASSLFTVTDIDNDVITRYQFFDNTPAVNSGYFKVNGVAQAAGTIIDVTASQLANTTFVEGTGSDALSVRAFDGTAWSDWAVFRVSAPNHAPVVVAPSVTAAQGANLAISSLVSVSDPDRDPITAYQFFDNSPAATSGHFVVNGVAKAAGTIVDVSPAQLAQTSFLTGTTADSLSVRAYDGMAWSDWTVFQLTPTAGNHAPVVVASDVVTTRGASLKAGALFSVTDADKDPITAYQFIDYSIGNNSGHFAVNGVTKAANSLIDVSAAQLAQTTFVAGVSHDLLGVRAFDGTAWSAWTTFDVSTPNHAPVVTASDITVYGAQSLIAKPQLSVSDADNDPIVTYQFWDSTPDAASGHFVLNGVAQAAGTLIQVDASQLAQLTFQTGTQGDQLSVRASDGMDWGTWMPFKVTVPGTVAKGSNSSVNSAHASTDGGDLPDNMPPPAAVSTSPEGLHSSAVANAVSAPQPTPGTGNAVASTASSNGTGNATPDAFVFGTHVAEAAASGPSSTGVGHDMFAMGQTSAGHAAALLTTQAETHAAVPLDTAHPSTLDHVTLSILQQYQIDHHFLA